MKSFFRFFAQRHILANLITIMIILLGLSTMMEIKRDIYPHVEFGIMSEIREAVTRVTDFPEEVT